MTTKYPITNRVKYLTGTKKSSFGFSADLSATPRLLHSYWDGGSKSTYYGFNLKTGTAFNPPTWGGNFDPSKAEYTPAPGHILISAGCFRGKPATPLVSCFPEDEVAVKYFLGIR